MGKDLLICPEEENFAKHPKQLGEYIDTNMGVVVPIMYFYHFLPHGGGFVKPNFLCTFWFMGKDVIVFGVKLYLSDKTKSGGFCLLYDIFQD